MIVLEGLSFPVVMNVLLYVAASILAIYILLKMAVWLLKDKAPKKIYAHLERIEPYEVKGVVDIAYALEVDDHPRLSLINAANEEVHLFLDGPQNAGEYSYPLHTDRFPNGQYKYCLKTNNQTSTRRLVIDNQ